MKQYIINGANGYIASNFIAELIRQKHHVIALVRGENDQTAYARMEEALKACTDNNLPSLENLRVYSYDLGQENFAISEELIQLFFEHRCDYYHFAACLKFSKETKDEIFETNIGGLENSISFFRKYASSHDRFFYVSSAYSCGYHDAIFEEKFYDNAEVEEFRNYYELSKRVAENIVKRYINEEALNAFVLRPSQVVGDTKTGITKTDFGVFGFIKRLARIAKRLPGQHLRIKINSEASQNLIPINVITQYFVAIAKSNELPRIINLVSESNTKNGDILEILNNLLPLQVEFDDHLDGDNMSHVEKIMEAGMAFTGNYTNSHIVFGTEALNKVKPKDCPSIDYDSLHSMIKYFTETS